MRRGEVVCIIGPSGAGKSTLLRCINHLEMVDGGTIYFEGRPVYRYVRDGRTVTDPERRMEEIRSQIGMVFQSFNLFPHLTASGNVVEAPMHVRREPPAEARERAKALLEGSASPTRPTPIRTSCRAASSSGWRSPGRWP